MHLRLSQIVVGVIAIALIGAFVFKNLGTGPASPKTNSANISAQKIGPPWAYPDPNRTPGTTNPDITQSNIAITICNPEWSTKSIRPPVSYTNKLKKLQMQQWDLPGATTEYEEDHFISLELGGNSADPRNLWPEPYYPEPGAKQKNVVENY